jgi:hypothetical protein
MAIQLDDDGNILIDPDTGLSIQISGLESLEQDARSECRCEQQGWFADSTFGRNPLVWKLPTSAADKLSDIKRIVTKYYNPSSITVQNDGTFLVE